MATVGLDPDQPYVVYVCSSPFVVNDSDDEVHFVTRLLQALRSSPTSSCANSVSSSGRIREARHGSTPIWPVTGTRSPFRHAAQPRSPPGRSPTSTTRLSQQGRDRHQHDRDDRGGDRRQERPHGPRAGVRPGRLSSLPLPAGGERRLPPRRLDVRGASRPARARARPGRCRRQGSALRRVLRPAARARPAGDTDPGRRRRGAGRPAHLGAGPASDTPSAGPAEARGGRLLVHPRCAAGRAAVAAASGRGSRSRGLLHPRVGAGVSPGGPHGA